LFSKTIKPFISILIYDLFFTVLAKAEHWIAAIAVCINFQHKIRKFCAKKQQICPVTPHVYVVHVWVLKILDIKMGLGLTTFIAITCTADTATM
jgi:hypothetical protein